MERRAALPRSLLIARKTGLRERGELRSPVILRLRDDILSTAEPLLTGQVPMRTEAEEPLLYADVVESGTARLFFTGNCVRA